VNQSSQGCFEKFLLINKKKFRSKMGEKFFSKWNILNMILINLCQWIKNNLNKFCGKENGSIF